MTRGALGGALSASARGADVGCVPAAGVPSRGPGAAQSFLAQAERSSRQCRASSHCKATGTQESEATAQGGPPNESTAQQGLDGRADWSARLDGAHQDSQWEEALGGLMVYLVSTLPQLQALAAGAEQAGEGSGVGR